MATSSSCGLRPDGVAANTIPQSGALPALTNTSRIRTTTLASTPRVPTSFSMGRSGARVRTLQCSATAQRAYSLRRRAMKPFPVLAQVSPRHREYNRRLSSRRSRIENTWARWKSRWKVTRTGDGAGFRLQFLPTALYATALLHNFCIDFGDSWRCAPALLLRAV